jgi:two-component system, OmpR family, phosphate regulon sensor histidine kinase PhoR
MTFSSTSDVSLYDLALQQESPLTTLQISPGTLKSITDSLFQMLIEQKMSAVVWAKLPRSEVWKTELERYASLQGIPKAIYSFTIQREDVEEAIASPSAPDAGTSDVEGMNGQPPPDHPTFYPQAGNSATAANSDATPVFSVQLPPDNALRREYFLIIWAPSFQLGVFTHRPRSAQQAKLSEMTTASLDILSSYGQMAQLLGATHQERKQLLLAVYSFDPELIGRSRQGLEHLMTQLQPSVTVLSPSPALDPAPTATALVEQWQQLIAEAPSSSTPLATIGNLVSKHLQLQEDLSLKVSAYRRQAEQAESLQLQNEELTNTLRLQDEFLSNVGQELRTPLTTIKTALSLLASPALKPPQRQRYMDLIAKECDRQTSLITSLLDLVNIDRSVDQASLPPLRLNDVVPGVVSTYQPVAEEKGVRLAYTIPEDLPAVACMSNWLKQIVINLLHNGIKFTPRGGQVWVRAKQQGDYIQLEIRDTGVGIAPSEIPKIFDRFYRVRQSADDSSGAGLGLTIVQQLLLHCGGSISVKSRIGEGSTFNVLLPVYRNPSEQSIG